ncbi:MAG TPA: DUF192 domain-containing protein [Hyphomicrobiales bacterium]|nr:DUF192 domain-containing protein [Hyphomicrobiales bacterium]
MAKTETALERIRGLLGKPALQDNQGFWIAPCNSVHTFGMRYPLDIVYLDRRQQIKKIRHDLKPFRISWHFLARSVIELRAGAVEALGLRAGDELQWVTHD